MKLEFIYNSRIKDPWSDVPKIVKNLEELKKFGVQYDIIDTIKMSDEKIQDLYYKAYIPSVKKNYRIRLIFGSRNYSGTFFGKNQPALLVYEDDREIPIDIYPHEKERQKISIEESLEEIRMSLKQI